MNTHKITIVPSNVVIEVEEGKDLLTAFRESSVYVKSSCGGHASCSDCIVKILKGEDNLNTPTFDETKLIGNVFHITKERLSCQVKVEGDVTVDVSSHDKSVDSDRIKAKSNKTQSRIKKPGGNIRRRTKDDVNSLYKERAEAKKEKEEKMNAWQNHWQKGNDQKTSSGGKKRPKTFRTDHLDEEDQENSRNNDKKSE